MKQKVQLKELLRISGRDIKDNILGLAGIGLSFLETKSILLTGILSVICIWLLVDMISTLRESFFQLREKHVPLVINVGDDDDFVDGMRLTANQMLQADHFHPETYKKYFDVEKSDLSVHREIFLSHNQEEWYRVLRRFESKVNLLNTRLQGRRNFHIFMKCPVALALGLGAVSGSKNAVILYHYIDSRYAKVFDLHCDEETAIMGTHALKNPVEQPFEYFEVVEPKRIKPTLYIAIGAASHPPNASVTQYAKGKDACIVSLNNTYGNTLGIDRDWRRAAQECITVIRKWATKKEIQNVEIFISSPLELAFGIGMGLGTPTRITINHWFREENAYHPVFNLNEI
jgi:hypothetical protein